MLVSASSPAFWRESAAVKAIQPWPLVDEAVGCDVTASCAILLEPISFDAVVGIGLLPGGLTRVVAG